MNKKIILAVWIIIIIFSVYMWWELYFDWKKSNSQEFQEIYMNLWDNYQIWKYNKINKLCNKDKKISCLNWEIKWFKQVNWEVYLYLYLYSKESIGTYSDWKTKVLDYSYKLFLNVNDEKSVIVKLKENIPKFWYLSNNELKFYSENDLINLSHEKQDIFKELEENPTIIIDGVDYSK